jgi:hypothetical protein
VLRLRRNGGPDCGVVAAQPVAVAVLTATPGAVTTVVAVGAEAVGGGRATQALRTGPDEPRSWGASLGA